MHYISRSKTAGFNENRLRLPWLHSDFTVTSQWPKCLLTKCCWCHLCFTNVHLEKVQRVIFGQMYYFLCQKALNTSPKYINKAYISSTIKLTLFSTFLKSFFGASLRDALSFFKCVFRPLESLVVLMVQDVQTTGRIHCPRFVQPVRAGLQHHCGELHHLVHNQINVTIRNSVTRFTQLLSLCLLCDADPLLH